MASLPLIDFSPFSGGNAADRKRTAQEIGSACQTYGFFYLGNHGIPQTKIDSIFAANRSFNALPLEQKMAPELRLTADSHTGYVPASTRQWENTGAPDLNEKIEFVTELPPDDPDIRAGDRWHVPNKWPRAMPASWRATVLDYFDGMSKLCARLHQAMALALDLDENYFAQFYRKPLFQMNLLHYPPQENAAPDNAFGIHPHSDGTTVTILAQDEVGGLQVLARDGSWIEATPIPGTFVINLGHLMARWTNDRFPATPHRVVNRTGRERYSVPFFTRPDFDTVISCLPGLGTPKYAPMHVGQSLKKKQAGDFKAVAELGDDAIGAR